MVGAEALRDMQENVTRYNYKNETNNNDKNKIKKKQDFSLFSKDYDFIAQLFQRWGGTSFFKN